MKEVLCLVLGGGRGTRLYPLTKERSKPAAPFVGKYRLVDIPISNALNSGFDCIYVLTQFNAGSLNKHIARTYKFDNFSQGFVEIMAAEQSMDNANWFQGTADAVRRSIKHFSNPHIKYVLILSGDQLYKMDFRNLFAAHKNKKSQITIACKPVKADQVSNYGIIYTDRKGRINSFVEKPQDNKSVKNMSKKIDKTEVYLASMGIYLFNKDTLEEILKENDKADFGREVIPESFGKKITHAYIYKEYWRDIGTIKAFYEENLVFTDSLPPVNLFDEKWKFFTRPRYLPPAKIEKCMIDRSIISEGTILHSCYIYHSIIGLRSRIAEASIIEDSIIMGADFYQSLEEMEEDKRNNKSVVGIGRNCVIRKAIIDKNVRIGDGTKLMNEKGVETFDSELYSIKDGIIIIPKGVTIPAGTVI